MRCIARKGMGSTTLGDVAGEAGLSQGIVNLHFKSKDNLLNETLRYLSEEYRTQFDRALEKSGPDSSTSLEALMELDLRPSICDRQKIAVWFAFWGEVKSRPAYQKICQKSDEYYDAVVERLCQEIINEGHYSELSAASVSMALTSMTNGMWLSCLISPSSFNRREARVAIDEYLHNIFPQHFPVKKQ